MITNSSLTIYHKTFNRNTRLEEWTRYNYSNVWYFGGKGASLDKGYENANDVSIRIPYDGNEINEIAIGDILVKGNVTLDINTQEDLKDYDVYNVTTIKNNNFGYNPHVFIGGK